MTNLYKILFFILFFLTIPGHCADLFDKLNDKLKKVLPQTNESLGNSDQKSPKNSDALTVPSKPIPPPSPANQNAGQQPSRDIAGGGDALNAVCKQVMGKPFKKKQVGSPEELVKKYFKMSADFEKTLATGIDDIRTGTLISLKRQIDDIKEKQIKNLADSFIADPSVSMLAQVIEYAERGDAFVPPRVPEPSERADAQTLLAMIMMQYPDHIASKDSVLYMLKSAEKGESGLAVVLIARAHMFGDYAPKDMNAFGAYMNNNSGKRYPVKFGTDSVFYALEKTPAGWKGRNEMLEQLKFSQEMNESFNRQKEAATVKGSDLSAQAFKLMEEGEKIDALTLEALGAGPKIAEIRAKGEMLNRESTGANDRIKVKVITSEEYSNAVKEMISIKPKLDSESKVKLERANQIRLDNVAQLRNLQIQVATQFYAGNIAEVIESGSMINRYYGNSCRLLYRQFELSKMTGAVVPDKSKIESAKEL